MTKQRGEAREVAREIERVVQRLDRAAANGLSASVLSAAYAAVVIATLWAFVFLDEIRAFGAWVLGS